MDPTRLFRTRLRARILHAAGLAALSAAPLSSACRGTAGNEALLEGAGGHGGGSTTTSTGETWATCGTVSSSATGTGTAGGATTITDAGPGDAGLEVGGEEDCGAQTRCFVWPAALPCPAAGPAFGCVLNDCHDACWVSGITGEATQADGECCYGVSTIECSGRPFLVGRARLSADLRPASPACGWAGVLHKTDTLSPETARLSPEVRAELAAAWARDGLLEHASVAAFARFSLELLAVGAPAHLIESAHAAAVDEVLHAQLCFALAGAYGGSPVEPGPFPFGGAVEVSRDLAAIAARAVTEGCIGETLAAVLCAEQLARAADPAVRHALLVLQRDEARHAELAWRFVAWALETGGADVSRAVADAFAAASSRVAPHTRVGPLPRAARQTEAHGRLDPRGARAARDRALHEVILPCAAALLSPADRRACPRPAPSPSRTAPAPARRPGSRALSSRRP